MQDPATGVDQGIHCPGMRGDFENIWFRCYIDNEGYVFVQYPIWGGGGRPVGLIFFDWAEVGGVILIKLQLQLCGQTLINKYVG